MNPLPRLDVFYSLLGSSKLYCNGTLIYGNEWGQVKRFYCIGDGSSWLILGMG
jgi:hypothetical protein